ncbi:MAG: AAA family ATPase, partial [Acidimicrobiia bacterium]|nr:AAA family ATPase [Acidimicrobiia bacterium]
MGGLPLTSKAGAERRIDHEIGWRKYITGLDRSHVEPAHPHPTPGEQSSGDATVGAVVAWADDDVDGAAVHPAEHLHGGACDSPSGTLDEHLDRLGRRGIDRIHLLGRHDRLHDPSLRTLTWGVTPVQWRATSGIGKTGGQGRGYVDCTECGRTNRPAAKFCAGCASPIVVPCASCGHTLAPESRFCDQCGTPIARDTATTGAPPSTLSDDAVRKTVTVVFCDLAGSTSMEERVDAESSREILGRYHSMVENVIVAGGGTVAKFIGDGAMAIFGIPEISVEDADRAVAAGLELQRRFLALRTHITGRFDVDVGLRVGINTGEVVIADADADLVGDALNVAARLEAACAPGEVLVGESTWRLTRATVAYESFGLLELKGKEEAVATYRAVDLLAVGDDSPTPFVGRDEELDRLRNVFDDAVATNSVRLATVIGAPGVGKTRLARELERALDDEATVLELRCERAGGTTFAPIADLIRMVAELDDTLSADETIERLTTLVGELDDAGRVGTLLAGFVGAAPMRSTEETFFAVRRLVEAMGRQRPVTIVIDDIQWGEALFLDLLEHLAEWGQDSAALLVGLARPELREIRPSLAEAGRRVSESIALEGLDARATAELAALLVGTDSLPADLLARLPESTEGNPLFVRELMKMLIDDDVIVETDRGWELAIDADAVEVPPTIQSLLSSRIERMPDDERRLVELAAVVGPEFPVGAVAAISTAGDSATLRATLERLRRKELVEPTGTYWGDEPLFRFHHVLIRDAAYRRLLKGRRADLHLRVAEWIEEVGASDAAEQQVTIGYHLEQAHDYRTQLDIADEETVAIGRRAAQMLGAAAARALERDDVAAAGSLAVRAVARLDADATERDELLMLGCEALFSLGDVAAAVPLLKELRGGSGDDARLAAWTRAFDAQLVVLTDPERLEEADAESAAAAAQLAALDDHAGEANARLVRSGALARLGRIGECEAELDLALGAARAADDGRRVAAVLGAAPVAALWGPSPVSRAGGRCLDVIRLLRITTGSPGVEATSTRCQAVLEALRGRFDTARAMLADALATVEELGLRHGWLETQLYSGIVELLAGDPAAAEPHLRSAYGGLGRLGIGADAGQAAAHLSRALLLQGRLDEADELATDSEALAGQNPQTAIAAKTARAEILAARGEIEDALRLAEEAVALAEGTDIVIDHANANVALARVHVAAGDAKGAAAARRAAEALFTAKGASVDLVDLDAAEPMAPDPVETAGEPARGDVPSGVRDDQPWNRADEVAHRADSADRPTDDLLRELFAHDFEFDNSRRSRYSAHVEGIDAWVEFVHRVRADEDEAAPDTIEEIERLAARGDHLVLWLRRRRSSSDLRGALRTRIELIRTDRDDRIDRIVHFDESDLGDALAELDRLYLADVDDLATRFAVAGYAEAYGALSGGDVDGVLASMDEAYVHHDHRPLGWGVLDRDEMMERFGSLAGVEGETRSYVARFRAREGPVDWTEARIRVTGPDGATQVDRQNLVNVFDSQSGMNIRTDRYDDDQLDEARAKFEASVAAAAAGGSPWNAAVQIGGHANRWAARGDWMRFASCLSDELIVEADGAAVVSDVSELHDKDGARRAGFGVADRRVLAVRGERLVLAEVRDGGSDGEPLHRLVIEEVDDECTLARVTHLARTELADAQRHLDLRWIELEAPSHAEVIRLGSEFTYALGTADSVQMRRLLADNARFVDHRELGLPDGRASVLIELVEANDGIAVPVQSAYLDVNERCRLTRTLL